MTCTITTLEKPDRLVLVGEGEMLSAVDSLEFAETAAGMEIRCTAELTFKGLARSGTRFVRNDLGLPVHEPPPDQDRRSLLSRRSGDLRSEAEERSCPCADHTPPT